MKLTRLIFAAAVVLLSLTANADPIQTNVEYQLDNHPDGNAGPPLYGLRLDGLTTGKARDIFTFEFSGGDAQMYLYWSGSELLIYGTVYGGLNKRRGYARGEAQAWDVVFVYYDTDDCGDGSGLCANEGYGYIEGLDGDIYHLNAYAGRHDYAFQLGYGHRGFDGLSGRGWLNHCSYASAPDGNCGKKHLKASDWLFTVRTVPEPTTLALLGLGLLGLGFSRSGAKRA